MNTKETGGPAFPATEEHGLNSGMPGMTLRDYFAAKALNGLFSAGGGISAQPAEWAHDAYRMADAMLEERKS